MTKTKIKSFDLLQRPKLQQEENATFSVIASFEFDLEKHVPLKSLLVWLDFSGK